MVRQAGGGNPGLCSPATPVASVQFAGAPPTPRSNMNGSDQGRNEETDAYGRGRERTRPGRFAKGMWLLLFGVAGGLNCWAGEGAPLMSVGLFVCLIAAIGIGRFLTVGTRLILAACLTWTFCFLCLRLEITVPLGPISLRLGYLFLVAPLLLSVSFVVGPARSWVVSLELGVTGLMFLCFLPALVVSGSPSLFPWELWGLTIVSLRVAGGLFGLLSGDGLSAGRCRLTKGP